MNDFFKNARDNIFMFSVYMILVAFFVMVSIKLLKGPPPVKLLGVGTMISCIYAITKFPDFSKYWNKK